MMLIDGEWHRDGDGFEMKLGPMFRAKVLRDGASSNWIATLNGQQMTTSTDPDYAKGRLEWEIVKELTIISAAYHVLKARAP